ncbi:hypothetical protein C9439_02995 [archaeon SCG-AAA382B04]|nr:hypothetical protein C9439_02995 [archaeon SCG-AAA382B04]
MVLLHDDTKYERKSFSDEEELEDVLEKYSDEIFGEASIFLNLKKKLRSKFDGLNTIPDGFLLDLSDPSNPVFYLVEVELARHRLDHIAPQLVKFAMAFNSNKNTIKKVFYENISRDGKDLIKRTVKESGEVFDSKRHLLDEAIVNRDEAVILMPIDREPSFLEEVEGYTQIDFKPLEVGVFESSDSDNEDEILSFTPLFEREGEPSTDVGTSYKFKISDVEEIGISREEFDEKHDISKYVQGFTFVRDEEGEPEKIVFQWYPNRVERHIEEKVEEGETLVGTSQPVNPSSYKEGMEVILGETTQDKDTGERKENPKYRLKGKLKEIYKISGDTKTKIFPK